LCHLWLDVNIDYSGFLFCRIGRKKTLFLSFGLALGSSVGVAFSPSYPVFVALRFLVGFSTAGIFMTAFVIGNIFLINWLTQISYKQCGSLVKILILIGIWS
jgi:MFS family permease